MGANMSKRRRNIKWETMIVLVAGWLTATAALAQGGAGHAEELRGLHLVAVLEEFSPRGWKNPMH